VTAIVLGVVLLAVLAIGYLREREHDRQTRDLIDRLQVPEVAAISAFSRAAGDPKPVANTDAEDDLTFGRDITQDLDSDWIPVGMDA
jgi:hypothetical protein